MKVSQRESCWSALCPCSDSKTQVPSSPSSVIAWLLVVLGIELVERPNSMEEACLPLKNGRGSTDLFMSHFVREWITSPTSNQRTVQGSAACLDSHVKATASSLSGGEGLGVAASPLHHWNPQPSTLCGIPGTPPMAGWVQGLQSSPGELTFYCVTHRSTGSLGSYGPHFSHLSNVGRVSTTLRWLWRLRSHSYLIC